MKIKDVDKLEQAKKRDKKIYITDIAISKVPLIHIEGLNEEQNEIFQQKHKELLRMAMTKNNSNEVANVFSLDFAHDIFHFGNEKVVNLNQHPTIADLIMNSNDNSVFVMHNHPSTQKFSYSDLGVLLANNSIFGISVVSNTGETQVLYKAINYFKPNVIELLKDIRTKHYSNGSLDEIEVVNEFLKQCFDVGIVYKKRGGTNGK